VFADITAVRQAARDRIEGDNILFQELNGEGLALWMMYTALNGQDSTFDIPEKFLTYYDVTLAHHWL